MSARFWWRRYRFWVRLMTAATAAAAIGLVAAAWVPGARAAILGAAVTAVATTAVLGVQAQWRRRSDVINSLPVALEIASSRGGFPLVRDVSDAVAAGVHPAAVLEVVGEADRVPPYITRDFEPELHAALRRDGFTLLAGESTAGKTRAAFEAMRLLRSGCRFVAPSSREALPGLLPSLDEAGDYVVWLDDLERFLGPGGLTLSVLHRLLSPPVRTVVLATMRSHEYDRYRDRLEGEMAGAERDVWREGRAVLRQAQVIYVNRRWTAQETIRVQAHASDRRLAQALASADRFGIAESLAAGPELAEAWRHAWTPGHHPRGAALIAAAVGARKAGYHRPLPQAVLERMHEAYLAQRGGSDLRPESLREAVQWALAPTFPGGANSLLIGSAEDGYLAFDYLIDLPGSGTMPDASWSALLEHASGYEAYMLANLALTEGRHDQAIRGYLRGAEAGNPIAEAMLGDLGTPVHPAPESLERAQQYLSQLRHELGSNHAQSLGAEQCVVMLTMQSGRHAEALTLAQDLVARGEPILGSGHRTVLALKHNIAWCTYALGDVDDGLRKLDSAVEECSRTLGPRNTTTVARRIGIVRMLTEAGRIDAARERLAALETDYSDFPPRHIIMIDLQKAANSIYNRERLTDT